jgi:hypothetical protein
MYPFEDKKSEYKMAPSTKLLIVIGRDKDNGILMFRTTTQAKLGLPDPDGCHADDSAYRFNQKRNKFDVPCWVQYEVPVIKEDREIVNAGGHVIFSLTGEEVAAVINCFKKSPELTNWTWEYCC